MECAQKKRCFRSTVVIALFSVLLKESVNIDVGNAVFYAFNKLRGCAVCQLSESCVNMLAEVIVRRKELLYAEMVVSRAEVLQD